MTETQPEWVNVQLPYHGNIRHGMKMRIPWRIHEKAWQTYHKSHTGQDAERLAARGGFGLTDLIYLLAGEDPYSADDGAFVTDFFNQKWSDE